MNTYNFNNRKALLVTMHEKEKAIAPALFNTFGISLESSKYINTDVLGTFSGEIKREESPEITAWKKIQLASNDSSDIIIASEGSFFPHPNIPFVTLNHEFILLYDKKNNVLIDGQHYTTDCIYFQKEFTNEEDAIKFCVENSFPQYGVVLKTTNEYHKTLTFKDPKSLFSLSAAFKLLQNNSANGIITVESDMRAHKNPKRMQSIEKATMDLVKNMNSFCPNCHKPGFSIRKKNKGLPCSDCGFPTNEIKENVLICQFCNHEKIESLPPTKIGNPMYCNRCNP